MTLELSQSAQTARTALTPESTYNVVVDSVGRAGAAVVMALKHISQLPESVLAARLFQAPSVLFPRLSRELADTVIEALSSAGLQCSLRGCSEPFTPGDSDHEVALVIRDFSRMSGVLKAVMDLLGVGTIEAKKLLCVSPSVLMGRISLATVAALRQRFEPLGVQLDVSRPAKATFDLFVGACKPVERERLRGILAALGIPELPSCEGDPSSMMARGLSHEDGLRLWDAVSRGACPARLVNRDFQRFDLRLESAAFSPELASFLVETAGMPEQLVPRALQRLPLVTHRSIRFAEMHSYLERIAALGGQATGHLLAFQSFALAIDKRGDADRSRLLVQALAGLSPESAAAQLNGHTIEGPLTGTQAQWLQYELRQAGTLGRMVLR